MIELGFAERLRFVMGKALLLCLVSLGLALPSARAQETAEPASTQGATVRPNDGSEARRAFDRGLQAFEEAQYETALAAFEEAFRLGGQGEVQYNIALAAERAGQEEKALAAYRAYLELVEEPPRQLQAEARVRALVFAGVDPEAAGSVTYRATEPYQPEPLPKRKRAIAGPVVFMTLGLAGLGAMTAGFLKDGKCVSQDDAGRCTEEAKLNKVPVAVYGSVGGALLFSGALWIGLSGRSNTVFGLGPGTIQVKGRF